MHAYFHARGISVLAGYPCYHWVMRATDDNASYEELEPVGYYQNVREVLDLIDEHMEPGPRRDRVRSHWYRGKMLGRVGGRNFLTRDPVLKRPLYEEIRKLALERYGDEVDEYLAFSGRVRSHLLRAGDFDGLEALARFEGGLSADVTVLALEPEEQRAVEMTFETRLGGEAGPFLLERDGERVRWVLPAELAGKLEPWELDVTDALERAYADVMVWSGRDGTEYLLRTETETRLEPHDGRVTPVLTSRARLEPRVAVAKANLRRGEWTVGVNAAVAGFSPPRVPAHGRRPLRVPLVMTVTGDGRIVPPSLRGDVARRFPGVARVLRRARAGASG
jgi:hypothetical protein